MDSFIFSLILLISYSIVYIFLLYRLSFFSKEKIGGRIPFIFGGLILLFALSWQLVSKIEVYDSWFIVSVYPIIDIILLGLYVSGTVLVTIGLALYTDFWQEKKDDLTIREQKLSIVNNLQRDARQPYQLMELLNLAIKEIVGQIPETCGAVFLVNRSQRQLVLASTVGLNKNEIALLERYPLGQNIITQAIELNEPLISGYFDFNDASRNKSESRINSNLVLPLVSGSDKIGCISLFSETKQHFSKTEIKYLMPLAEWLAEKIKSAKLQKDLNLSLQKSEKIKSQQDDFKRRLVNVTGSYVKSDMIASFCRSLIGLLDCQSVHFYGLKNGSLNFYGGSEPLLDLSENYKTALIDALDKNKPLILNQEAQNSDGRSFIVRSTFIYPLGDNSDSSALMFVSDKAIGMIDEDDLKILSVYGNLAELTLKQSFIKHLSITRRKGFEKVLSLLNYDRKSTFEKEPEFFVNHISSIVPPKTIAVTFFKNRNGSFKAVKGYHTYSEDLNDFDILPGEGVVGELNTETTAKFIYGRSDIETVLKSFNESNRNIFYKLFDEEGVPVFLAVCPLKNSERMLGAAILFMYNISEQEKSEWERLITLASGLYSLRLTLNKLYQSQPSGVQFHTTRSQNVGEVINKLNNHLNAIIGNAELANLNDEMSGEIKNHFQSIINEADRAAQFLKQSMVSLLEESKDIIKRQDNEIYINDIIEEVLDKSFISDNIFMIGGRPHEVNNILGGISHIDFENENIKNLFEETINRFASLTDEEDVITISTYVKDSCVYLDISRHHKNFPPVDRVSEFGEYQLSEDVLKYRPVDTYLKNISENNCYYSYDRYTSNPSYLSFKFPVSKETIPATEIPKAPRILAIDDQTVILDLISAMAQTSGYQIETADSGEKGLKMALEKRFDIILTDLAMPGLSGLELSRELRKNRLNIPIVLLTGWEVNLDKSQLKASGVSEVLYKPFRIEQLTEIIETLTAKSQNIR